MMIFLKAVLKHTLLKGLFLLALALFTPGLTLPVIAARPTTSPADVELLRFEGASAENGVFLEWATATEVNTAGFRLKRAAEATGPFAVITVTLNNEPVQFVPSAGSAAAGATYQVLDEAVINGESYWYILVEVESDDSEHELTAPLLVLVGLTATPTPLFVATDQPPATVTPAPTSTDWPTNTPVVSPSPLVATPGGAELTATALFSVSVTATIVPSVTPLPTRTPLTNHFATPTAFAFPTASSPQAIAQVEPSPTIQPGYPGPATVLPVLSPSAAVNGAVPAVATPAQATGYPFNGDGDLNFSDIFPTGTAAINDPIGAVEPTLPAATATQAAGSGRLFLWAGFVAALLIFGAGVFGSIAIFTRQGSKDR